MRREPHGRLQSALLVGWPIALALVATAGCDLNADKASLRRWWAATGPAQPSASVSAAVSETSHIESAGTEREASTQKRNQTQAANRAVEEAEKAEIAAKAAKKASEEAIQASKQASEAAAQVGNAKTVSDKKESDAGQLSPTAPSAFASPPVVLSSTTEGTEGAHKQLAETLDSLEQSLGRIDRTKLSNDDTQRLNLASNLLQSARKALSQNDYSEANGLVTKASVIMAPVIASVPNESPSNGRR